MLRRDRSAPAHLDRVLSRNAKEPPKVSGPIESVENMVEGDRHADSDTICIAFGQDEMYRGSCDTIGMDRPADRLKKAREMRGYPSPTEAAQAFGWPEVTYRAHENGGRGIKAPVAERYAKAFRVKAGWILLGDDRADDLNEPAAPPAGYRVEPNAVFDPGPVFLPTIGAMPRDIQELGATVGGFGDDDSAFEMNGQVVDLVPRPPGIAHRKDVFALRVSNNSMWPLFKDGERIYVEKRKPAIGDNVVVELHPSEDGRPGKSFIKCLVSRNSERVVVEQYKPFGHLEFEGREIKEIFRVIPWAELLGVG